MREEDPRKGTTVTKPIDLKTKKPAVPIRGRQESQGAGLKERSPAGEPRPAVQVSTIAAVRPRAAPKPEIIEQIGLRLRGVYNDVLMQPIPDRFIELLGKLEADAPRGAEREARGSGSKKGAK